MFIGGTFHTRNFTTPARVLWGLRGFSSEARPIGVACSVDRELVLEGQRGIT